VEHVTEMQEQTDDDLLYA